MDGNRRWAKSKSLPVFMGHKKGLQTLEEIVEVCAGKDFQSATFYAFSTENWRRSEDEVSGMMKLIAKNCERLTDKCMEHNLKFKLLGDIDKFNDEIREKLQNAQEKTKNNTEMTVNIALNYGGRAEIVMAAKRCAEIGEDITEENIEKNLYTYPQAHPDLIIRTGGEMRISNFLVWQSAYSELYFTDIFWPSFNEKELEKALEEYSNRKRNYGE